MELVEGGSLYHKIPTARMSEDEIRFYIAELVSVLQYLHTKNIVYRYYESFLSFFDEK